MDLPPEGRAGLAVKIDRYRHGESRRGDVDSLGDGILEIRHREQTVRFRVLFTKWGRHYVGLTAFCKKEPKTPKIDLERAQARARRWRELHDKEADD
jgi:phage-related protein